MVAVLNSLNYLTKLRYAVRRRCVTERENISRRSCDHVGIFYKVSIPSTPHGMDQQKARFEVAAHERDMDWSIFTNNQSLFGEILKIRNRDPMEFVSRHTLLFQMPVLNVFEVIPHVDEISYQQVFVDDLEDRRPWPRQRYCRPNILRRWLKISDSSATECRHRHRNQSPLIAVSFRHNRGEHRRTRADQGLHPLEQGT